jgi:hypothetical protein
MHMTEPMGATLAGSIRSTFGEAVLPRRAWDDRLVRFNKTRGDAFGAESFIARDLRSGAPYAEILLTRSAYNAPKRNDLWRGSQPLVACGGLLSRCRLIP